VNPAANARTLTVWILKPDVDHLARGDVDRVSAGELARPQRQQTCATGHSYAGSASGEMTGT
jgi:hypothetical protein